MLNVRFTLDESTYYRNLSCFEASESNLNQTKEKATDYHFLFLNLFCKSPDSDYEFMKNDEDLKFLACCSRGVFVENEMTKNTLLRKTDAVASEI